MRSALRIEGRTAPEIRAVIESFLKNCRQPALLEPGQEVLPLTADNFSLESRGVWLGLLLRGNYFHSYNPAVRVTKQRLSLLTTFGPVCSSDLAQLR
jgi:hypothetical protein